MERKFRYWLAVEEGQPVKFGDLPHLIAKALHPGEEESFAYACARLNLEKELPDAVDAGTLTVRNASGLGVHTFPVGEALRHAVVLPWELRPFLEARGIELRETPHGSGPKYWTLSNAATAIAEQEGWHNGARGALLDSMMEATQHELTIRDPLTGLPKTSGTVREFWETVTPADVNAWLEKQDAPYRWNVPQPTGYEEWLASSEADAEARQDPTYKEKYDRAWMLYGEREKWERMEHGNDPLKAAEIEARLNVINVELAALSGIATDPNRLSGTQKDAAIKREVPSGGDALTPVVWEICYDLDAAGRTVTAAPVMGELRKMAEEKRWPLLCVVAGGVKFEYESGDEKELSEDALRKRITEWKRKAAGG